MAAVTHQLRFTLGALWRACSASRSSARSPSPVDLALLTAFHGALRWPLPVAITVAYVLASGLGYSLNRTLNSRSHCAVGPQLTVYAAVVTVNFLALILGVSTGLAALGLDYRLARLTAAGCECVYMYSAMRWLVFRDAGPKGEDQAPLILGRCSPPRRMKMRRQARPQGARTVTGKPRAFSMRETAGPAVSRPAPVRPQHPALKGDPAGAPLCRTIPTAARSGPP